MSEWALSISLRSEPELVSTWGRGSESMSGHQTRRLGRGAEAVPESEGNYHSGFRDWFDDNPAGGRSAHLEFRELRSGIWLQPIQLGTGNAMSVQTSRGVVQVDAGMNTARGAEMVSALRTVCSDPVRAIVYSHGHIAYNEGVPAWLADAQGRGDPEPRRVAHVNVPRRYSRYRDSLGYQERTTEIQFGFEPGSLNGVFEDFNEPTETYEDHLVLVDAEPRVELIHAPAETDDATAVWMPDAGILYGGGATIGGFPNIGSPLRTPRDPKRWADTLEMFVDLKPELLIREYGSEITGAVAIAEYLESTTAILRYLRSQTMDRLNTGMMIADIVADINVPADMVDYPWMTQSYGCCEYVIRDTYLLETGWWNRDITDLHPARPCDAADAVASAIVDHEAVLERARELHGDGEHQLALHVIDLLANVNADGSVFAEARALKRTILLALAEGCPVYQSENFYRSAARSLEERN